MIARLRFLVLTLAVCLFAPPSWALIQPGAVRPAARVVDAEGRALDLRAITGKPILVLYEDKGSAEVNAPLKKELSVLAKGDRYRTAVALVPVADVESYDFWPARGFVKSAIRSESRKIGATIYCDWDGSFRRAARIRAGTSNVLLIGGRDAKVIYAWEGPMPKEERQHFLRLLRAEVDDARSRASR
jgi:hypothetical protein